MRHCGWPSIGLVDITGRRRLMKRRVAAVTIQMTLENTSATRSMTVRMRRVRQQQRERRRCVHDSDDSREHFSYQEYDSEDEESETATEGEEEVRARELRRQEARVEAPDIDTGSDTEVTKHVHSDVDFTDKDFEFELPPDFNVTEFLSEFESGTEICTTDISITPDSEVSRTEPPDVIRNSHIATSPELISEISPVSESLLSVNDMRASSPPVPVRRKKSNSFRITASNINVYKPEIVSLGDGKIPREVEKGTPPVLPLRKAKIAKPSNTLSLEKSVKPFEEKLSKLRISSAIDKPKKNETILHNSFKVETSPSSPSIYGTPLASPSTPPTFETSKKISHIVEKATGPNADKGIKSILVSKMDKRITGKEKPDSHHPKDCIVM
uniref:Uncharacterized protein n=2 Tax=Homalodisca liturata TaxID=320908 RepID=A0A1B6IRC4_9HEMI